MYDVVEADEMVEVCVITCNDIADRVIKAHVFGPSENVYIPIPQIPPGSMLASKLKLYCTNCTSRHVYTSTHICFLRNRYV